jgi:ArsR family transcriptional regulator, lead/cadmium/zinc/bismuth-responsive transcriptional repressor
MNIYSYIRYGKMNRREPVCRITVVHEDEVRRVAATLPAEETMYVLADFFKVLGDTTRARILSALLRAELCVCDIAAVLNMSQSAVSHQLRILRQTGLVKYRRAGKIVYYSLEDSHVEGLMKMGLEHVEERT